MRLKLKGTKSGPGSQMVYARGAELVIEWYDHGEGVAYESANLLVLDKNGQAAMARELGADEPLNLRKLAHRIVDRFDSYFEVREYLDARRLPYDHRVDFDV